MWSNTEINSLEERKRVIEKKRGTGYKEVLKYSNKFCSKEELLAEEHEKDAVGVTQEEDA